MKSGTQGKTKLKVSKKPEKTPEEAIDELDNKKKKFLNSLANHRGNITKACLEVDIRSRQTIYNWLENDLLFKEEFENVNESEIDHVEDKLKERIDGVQIYKGKDKDGKDIIYSVPPDTTAIIFHLKTKGKKRGYIEKTEIETITKHDFSKASDSELDEEIKKYE